MEFTEKQQSQLINQFIDNTKESKLVAQAALSATSTEFLMSVRKNPNTSNLNYTDIISTEIHKEKMKLVDQDKQVSYTDLPESEKEKNRVLAREITALVENMKKDISPDISPKKISTDIYHNQIKNTLANFIASQNNNYSHKPKKPFA